VGKREPLGAELEVAEQQHVHVDRTRPVANASGGAAELALDGLALVEQLLRAKRRAHAQAGVQEVRLVFDLALRRRLVHGRGRQHLHPAPAERITRGAQVRQPVSLVGAQPEVAQH
jgi:hypothetical protein